MKNTLTMADKHHGANASLPVPADVIGQVSVIVFKDGSIYVGGPSVLPDGRSDESMLEATLRVGLELMTGGGTSVEVHEIHGAHELLSSSSGPAEA